MICKECGAKIEGLTRICPHCGERALIDDELDTWSFIADTAAQKRHAMPEEIVLNTPAPIPQDRTAQIEHNGADRRLRASARLFYPSQQSLSGG